MVVLISLSMVKSRMVNMVVASLGVDAILKNGRRILSCVKLSYKIILHSFREVKCVQGCSRTLSSYMQCLRNTYRDLK